MTTRRPGFTAAAALIYNALGSVNPGAHRYWRLRALSTQASGTGANDNFAVAEVALRAFLSGSDVSGGLTYASSTTTGVGFEAAEAFDDNTGTHLDTTEANDAWVSVDFGVGNDSEIHEIALTNVANATRKAPAVLRVEYSDDNSMWFAAWEIEYAPWTDTQETRVSSAPYGQAQFVTTDYNIMSPTINCVGAWGTLLRNHGYGGPALRVEDNSNPGTFTDVNFDADGLVRGATPYGADTRVVTVYDQFGSTDLFAVLADNITITQNDGEVGVWSLKFNGNGELTSTVLTGSSPAWEAGAPVWAMGCHRVVSSGFYTLWGIPSSPGVMEMGLQQDSADLHWRVNGGGAVDMVGTDWWLNADVVHTPGIERVIVDMSDGSPAQAWYKGIDGGTRIYTAPITYGAGNAINVGGGLTTGIDFTGNITELAIFDPSTPITVGEKDLLDAALAEADFFVTGSEVVAQEQRVHVILGAATVDAVNAKSHRAYAILGAPPDAVSADRAALFVLLGNATDSLAARAQRLHAIIVP